MEQVMQAVYGDKRLDLLRQILLRSDTFTELEHILGLDLFWNFLQSFRLIKVKAHTSLELKTGSLYYFASEGTLTRKVTGKSNLMSRGAKVHRNRASQSTEGKISGSSSERVVCGQNTGFSLFLEPHRRTFATFHTTQPLAYILKFSTESGSSLPHQIKNYLHSKAKFLSKFHLFQHLCISQIEEFVDKFSFIKLGFNDTLYDRYLRNQYVFFLEMGQYIVESEEKNVKSYITQAPTILGEQKIKNKERVRCLNESCCGYKILRSDVEAVLQTRADGGKQNLQFKLSSNNFLRQNKIVSIGNSLSETNDDKNLSFGLSKNEIKRSCIFARKSTTGAISEQKKMRVKEHFSNFMNERYEEFSFKKSTGIDFSQQQPILYQIKPLVPKSPEYSEMNSRLKRIRIRKILEDQTGNKKSKSTEDLLICKNLYKPNNEPLFSNNHINCRIWRKLETRIASKLQNKNPYLLVKNST